MVTPILPPRGLRVRPGPRRQQVVRFEPRGAVRQLMECRDFEVLTEGPVGTGKTFGVLWKMHAAALKYPGMRGLLLRKTQVSLTASAIQTYVSKILTTANYGVVPFSGNIEEPRSFRYPNGSRLVVGGMDKASKVMSSDYDMVAFFEATEATLDDHEAIVTRLRNGVMPYQQFVLDCNPDVPTHWLNVRANTPDLTRLLSRHKDNPRWWDDQRKCWTEAGEEYVVRRLSSLTGVRRKRYLDGIWAAAEGQIYETWDAAVHLIDRFDIPWDWPRFWVIDFGYVNPFVWQAWAIGPDGDLFMYREIYMTRRLVAQHAQTILDVTANDPRPIAVIADHDAEDRATFEAETRLRTTAANKAVSSGIQAVAKRLAPDARPRIRYLRDSRVEMDPALIETGKPASTVDEFPSYIWDLSANRLKGDTPVKKDDHGMDATRYAVVWADTRQGTGMRSVVDAYASELD